MDARRRPLTLIALAGLGSCSSASYAASADEEVDRVLGTATETTLSNRREWIIQPTIEEPQPAKPEAKEGGKEEVKPEAKPEAKVPEAKQPEAKKPEAKEPEAKEPEVKPDAEKPEPQQ